MITKNLKGFKKVSYFCLTLFSTAVPLTSEAAESLLKEYADPLVLSRSVAAPEQGESFFSALVRPLRLLFADTEDDKDKVQGDIQSVPMESPERGYRETHNRIVDKYPELAHHRMSARSAKQGLALVPLSQEFRDIATRHRGKQETENKKLQEVQEDAANTVRFLAKAVVENHVKDVEAKSFFLKLVDRITEKVLR